MRNYKMDWYWFLAGLSVVALCWWGHGLISELQDAEDQLGRNMLPNGPVAFVSEGPNWVDVLDSVVTCVTDTINPVCEERGHIKGGLLSLDACCGRTRYVDQPDRTLGIKWIGENATFLCKRCGEGFSRDAIRDTTVIWQRE